MKKAIKELRQTPPNQIIAVKKDSGGESNRLNLPIIFIQLLEK